MLLSCKNRPWCAHSCVLRLSISLKTRRIMKTEAKECDRLEHQVKKLFFIVLILHKYALRTSDKIHKMFCNELKNWRSYWKCISISLVTSSQAGLCWNEDYDTKLPRLESKCGRILYEKRDITNRTELLLHFPSFLFKLQFTRKNVFQNFLFCCQE